MSFQEAFQTIKDGIGDLSELNVRTFTGDMSVAAVNVSKVKLVELLQQGGADLQVKVVGITNMKIDGDVDQFITSSDVPAMAITAHTAAIEAGQKSRQAMFDLFTDAIGRLSKAVS
jgi:hypothetical protein